MTDIQSMKLRPGDTVGIVATARKTTPEMVEPSVKLLESWGLKVRLADGLYDVCNQFAGDDRRRASSLQSMLDDESVRAVFCACGGYGTVRILDSLDFTLFKRNPKWIVGFSDVTALHCHVATLYGIPTLHATMPINIPMDAATTAYPSLTSLRRLLFDCQCEYTLVNDDVSVPNRPGECQARIVGGNLSVIYSLLGSASEIDTEGKILLIEDLDEMLYHVDRMMMALKRAGKLAGLKGLIVGALTQMHDNEVPFGYSAEEIVRNAVSEYGYPVVYHGPFGHIGTENLALPLGVVCSMNVRGNETFIKF